MEDTTPYPKLLGCNLCGAMHRAETPDERTAWANEHHAEHDAKGEALAYTVLPVPEMAELEDIGGGFRVVKHR